MRDNRSGASITAARGNPPAAWARRIISASPNMYEVDSSTVEGSSTVRVQFQWGTDIGKGAVDVLQLVERARQRFPTDPTLQTPIVFKYDPSQLPILIFGVFPPLDLLIGLDSENPPDSVLKWLEQDRYYRWCTFLFLPLQYAGLVFACTRWASGDLSTIESLGLAVSMAMVAGIGINTAHELGHKRASSERWLSRVARWTRPLYVTGRTPRSVT